MKEFRLKDTVSMSPFLFHVGKACVNGKFPEHRHDFSELVIIQSGTGVHFVGGHELLAMAGNVHVVNPGQSHGFREGRNLTMYNISYNNEIFSALRSDVRSIPGFQSLFILGARSGNAIDYAADRLSMDELSEVATTAEEMLDEYREKHEGYESLLVGCFLKLVVYLSRNYRAVAKESSSSVVKLARAVGLVEGHFTEALPLSSLSAVSGLSARHLSRLFRENLGMSPTNYVIRTRLDHAAHLLRAGRKAVTEIALDSGFEDSNYFARQFRSAFGMSPTSYRRRFGEEGRRSGLAGAP